mmetsp:Transcript_40499/g.79244  ORF Transcript_40499/g.79244 Transcript_40499/m.79244 type:complete len:366 (+) Transcript_40499:364-1461(+)
MILDIALVRKALSSGSPIYFMKLAGFAMTSLTANATFGLDAIICWISGSFNSDLALLMVSSEGIPSPPPPPDDFSPPDPSRSLAFCTNRMFFGRSASLLDISPTPTTTGTRPVFGSTSPPTRPFCPLYCGAFIRPVTVTASPAEGTYCVPSKPRISTSMVSTSSSPTTPTSGHCPDEIVVRSAPKRTIASRPVTSSANRGTSTSPPAVAISCASGLVRRTPRYLLWMAPLAVVSRQACMTFCMRSGSNNPISREASSESISFPDRMEPLLSLEPTETSWLTTTWFDATPFFPSSPIRRRVSMIDKCSAIQTTTNRVVSLSLSIVATRPMSSRYLIRRSSTSFLTSVLLRASSADPLEAKPLNASQ